MTSLIGQCGETAFAIVHLLANADRRLWGQRAWMRVFPCPSLAVKHEQVPPFQGALASSSAN